ncbi:DUF1643 domain-containing protein [Synechococcus sp. CS-602]|uniref:DUF1643 domain-containing protein n=1 Tax=Synechococcaceae TaxID=1890426 RepID=UPI0008FF358C|nr:MULTISPECIES: DUF1643 domain-containing protein [Synechococcaceae]MCT4363475.1 DUF1643 domain-containing protein [Candidatus Regnicoccus frigidus MAG-AL1]APD48458.1 hypothetical protein BM449_09705 [Synechococcus sp. SynAce01]MCT0203287.1 DUF1643 domain-containing protein [Synechococcus sp. CS-603]MCT0205233.1 DUF1643 domain-containing protein [Synechococcus sp. CS-602]MCT0246726.1 DUF1643 domain-containing protein [Synechococcus sp. CS-601]
MGRSAVFSPWGLYRYVLWRHWQRDDATTRRCIRFAQDWGYGGLCLTNLFAFRARHPATLLAAEKPVGPENAAWLRACAASSATVVAAWGRQGTQAGRDCQATAPRWLFCRRCRCCASAKPPNPCTLFTCRKTSDLLPGERSDPNRGSSDPTLPTRPPPSATSAELIIF